MTVNRVSQLVTEVLTDADPNLRTSQLVTEVLADTNPNLRVSQNVVEVLSTFVPEITSEGTTFLNGQDKSASSTWNSATTSLTINAEQWGIIVLVTDNEDSTDLESNLHTSVSVGSSVLTKAREYSASQGSPNSGSTVSVWYFQASGNIASGAVIAVTLNSGRTAKAITGHAFDIDSPYIITGVDGTADENIAAGKPGALTATGSKDAWHFWVRGIGLEWPTDTLGSLVRTNSRWFGMNDNGSTGNPDESNQSVRVEYRIGFGVSSNLSDPDLTSNSDGVSTMVGLLMGLPIGHVDPSLTEHDFKLGCLLSHG